MACQTSLAAASLKRVLGHGVREVCELLERSFFDNLPIQGDVYLMKSVLQTGPKSRHRTSSRAVVRPWRNRRCFVTADGN